jgi:hypothetical protein
MLAVNDYGCFEAHRASILRIAARSSLSSLAISFAFGAALPAAIHVESGESFGARKPPR